MIILVHRESGRGTAAKKFERIQNWIQTRWQPKEIAIVSTQDFLPSFEEALKSEGPIGLGGGDGTFWHAINHYMRAIPEEVRHRYPLGLIGLGSRNSFLRSCPRVVKRRGILCRLDPKITTRIDLGHVQYRSTDPKTIMQKYFLASGSFGFLAMCNELFNRPQNWWKKLKDRSLSASRTEVFLESLWKFSPQELTVLCGEKEEQSGRFLNLQILKSRYYSGGLYFPSSNPEHSGLFDIRATSFKSRRSTVSTLAKLATRRFGSIPEHQWFTADRLCIRSPSPIPMELDGEIIRGQEFEIRCLREALHVCT